jgi:hypothetical protein
MAELFLNKPKTSRKTNNKTFKLLFFATIPTQATSTIIRKTDFGRSNNEICIPKNKKQ